MSKDNGGPAFPIVVRLVGPCADPINPDIPVPAGTTREHTFSGMSLRDYFAGKGMHAFLVKNQVVDVAWMAELAYAYADAMLAERSKA